MGGRAGGGASGGMGSASRASVTDAMVARLASDTKQYTTKDLNWNTEPLLKNGEYLETHGSFNGGGIYEVHNPSYEKITGDVAETRPDVQFPKTAKQKAKYLADYKTYDAKWNAAVDKVMAAYKKDIPRAKTKAMKVYIAKQISKYQGWKKDSVDIMKWMEKTYGAK